MNPIRYIFLSLLLLIGAFVLYTLYRTKSQAPLGTSFSPALQLMGKSTSSLNVALTRIMPIDEMDERAYGEALAKSYYSYADTTGESYSYLNALMGELSIFSSKDFDYRVFVVSGTAPNAFALPGGLICVTKGLLSTLTSEAELIAVLSHEIGHIELGHCFDAIKYELTFKKVKSPTLGKLADMAFNLFLGHSFSKTQENAADEYGYDLLLQTKYDPRAFSGAFMALKRREGGYQGRTRGTVIDDYLKTHPPLPSRIDKFQEMAKAWWADHEDSDDRRYVGAENLAQYIPLSQQSYDSEWVGHKARVEEVEE